MRIFLATAFFCVFAAIANAQSLRSGDTLEISVWQDSKLDRRVLVGPTGMISFPLAGHIRARGLTPQGLEDALRSRLQKNYTERLDITVALVGSKEDSRDEDQKPRIFVTGEIKTPGSFVYRKNTTVMQAIATAGGLGVFAAKGRIQVRRQIKGVETFFVFDYRAFESGADLTGNIDLQPNDVIIVPERGLFD